jgi:ribosomal protein L16 Arg81 hydroxylase
MRDHDAAFAELIAPVATATFFAEFWEQEYLHLPRNRRGFFDDLFSIADVDRWLMSVRNGLPDSVLVTPPAGAESGKQSLRPQDVSIEELYASFAKGSSIVINYLEDSWPPLSGLVKMLGSVFSADIGINMYLTPKGSRTFPVHVDDHDVLVLQVYGEKSWNLHDLRLVPVNGVRLAFQKDLAFTSEWGGQRIKTPLRAELCLQPGDVLYIPRGMPHCAFARDSTSLHLTVSITPLYWMDFLKAAVEQAHVHLPGLRRSLPPGFTSAHQSRDEMRQAFAATLRTFAEHASFDETFDTVVRSRVRAQGVPRDGHFAQLDRLDELALDSALCHRPGILCVAYKGPGFSNIRFGSRHVRGPAHLYSAMAHIEGHERFRVHEIPGLDDQSKLVLARRLIREGLLRFAEPRYAGASAEFPAAGQHSGGGTLTALPDQPQNASEEGRAAVRTVAR